MSKPTTKFDPGLVAARDVTEPARYEAKHMHAIKAMAGGTASPEQQQIAFDWIVRGAADAYGLSFRPGDPHSTSFKEGQRYVGLQILKLLNLNPAVLSDKPREQPS